MARIRNIEIRKDVAFIRIGKTELEIAGGAKGLREWVKDQADRLDDFAVAALRIRDFLRDGGDLKDVATLCGKDLSMKVEAANG